jgi:hypothetical protein
MVLPQRHTEHQQTEVDIWIFFLTPSLLKPEEGRTGGVADLHADTGSQRGCLSSLSHVVPIPQCEMTATRPS